MLTGFVVAPFLVNRLGETSYGLWILIASLTGYFASLDLGVSGSLGRNLAFYLAKKDVAGVRGILNTSLAILGVVALLALVATFAVLLVFFRLFDVPPDQVDDVRLALFLVGISLSLSFPLGVFDGTLWALQRFDINNAIDIPTVLARAGLTFYCIGAGGGLVELAWITLATTVAEGLVKIAVSFWLEPSYRLSFAAVRWSWAGQLYGYGVWYFLLSLVKNIQPQIGPTVVGHARGPDLVTPYRIAAQLCGYGNTFISTATQVLTPLATALHAREEHDQQKRLFEGGGKVCLTLSLYLFALFFFLGQPFIALWMGHRFAYAWSFLVVLAAGEVLPMSQWISYSLFLAKGRHRSIAVYGLVEIVAALVLALVLVEPWGLMGVCVALALPATLFRGIVRLVYGCRLLNLSGAGYLVSACLPALCWVTPQVTLLALLTWSPPQTWFDLLWTGGLSATVFGLATIVQILGWQRVARVLQRRGVDRCEPVQPEKREERDVVRIDA
jgi:O-antigen/teichoic acid export membrane protein